MNNLTSLLNSVKARYFSGSAGEAVLGFQNILFNNNLIDNSLIRLELHDGLGAG